MNGFMNTQEAADALGIKRGGVNVAIKRGRFNFTTKSGKPLTPQKIGRDWFIPVESIKQYGKTRKKGWPLGVKRKK